MGISTGEDERAQATSDDADAKIALDALAVALGEVDFQIETNAALVEIGNAAVAAKNAALIAHQNAAQVLLNANQHFNDETTRTTSEEETFSQVEALMATLA